MLSQRSVARLRNFCPDFPSGHWRDYAKSLPKWSSQTTPEDFNKERRRRPRVTRTKLLADLHKHFACLFCVPKVPSNKNTRPLFLAQNCFVWQTSVIGTRLYPVLCHSFCQNPSSPHQGSKPPWSTGSGLVGRGVAGGGGGV